MKSLMFLFCFLSITIIGCDDNEVSLTGDVRINFENSLPLNLDVSSGLYFDGNDTNPFSKLFNFTVANGGSQEIIFEELLPGNYYFKYRIKDTGTNNWSGYIVEPFQIIGGKENELFVDI